MGADLLEDNKLTPAMDHHPVSETNVRSGSEVSMASQSVHPFKCSECPTALPDRLQLMVHQRRHASSRPQRQASPVYQCTTVTCAGCQHQLEESLMQRYHAGYHCCRQCRTVFGLVCQLNRHSCDATQPEQPVKEERVSPEPADADAPADEDRPVRGRRGQPTEDSQQPSPNSEADDQLMQSSLAGDETCSEDRSVALACGHCSAQFQNKSNLRRHVSAKHSGVTYDCEECPVQFSRLDVLVLHTVDAHQQEKTLPCSMCSRKFTQQRIVQYHLERAHISKPRGNDASDAAVPSRGPYKCEQCPRGFSSRIRLGTHRSSVHGAPGQRYQCDVCPQSYTRGEQLTRHSVVVHGQKRSFTCQRCPRAFTQRSLLELHLQYHGRPRAPYRKRSCVCATCGGRFHTDAELAEHRCRGARTHSPPPVVVCDVCGRTLSTTTALRRHKLQHAEARPAVCEECGRGFVDTVSLQVHRQTHRTDTPHVCHVCGKGFKARAYLTRHVKFHSGERPHVCEHCGKAFKIRYTLQHHLRIHTGEKPFVCQLCSRPFRQSHQLKTHMKVHASDRRPSPGREGKEPTEGPGEVVCNTAA